MRKFSNPLHFRATFFLFNISAADGGRCNMFHGDFMQIPSRPFFIKLTLVMHNCTQLSNLVPWISDVHLNLSHPDKLPRTSCFPFLAAPLASLSPFNGRNFPSTWEWIFHLKSEEKSLFVTAVVETVYNLLLTIKEVFMEGDQKMWVEAFEQS